MEPNLLPAIENAFKQHSNAITSVGNELKALYVRLLRAEYIIGLLSAKELSLLLTQINNSNAKEVQVDTLEIVKIVEDFNKQKDAFYKNIREPKCETSNTTANS